MKTKNKWLAIELFNGLANAIVVNFISLYVWQTHKMLAPILRYHIALFVGIPLAGLFASYISKKINPKVSFFLSFFARLILLVAIIQFSSTFIEIPEVFGAVSALACGLFIIPKNIVFQLTTEGADREKQTAILTSGKLMTRALIFYHLLSASLCSLAALLLYRLKSTRAVQRAVLLGILLLMGLVLSALLWPVEGFARIQLHGDSI